MTFKDWIIIVVLFMCLLFVGIGIMNRYEIVTAREATYRMDKITGEVTWIVGNKSFKVIEEKGE